MKKLTILLLALSLLLASITSCSGFAFPDSTSSDTDTPETESVYDLLNNLSEKNYTNIEVKVTTSNGFSTLYSNFELTQTSVVYSIEKLNLLPSDGSTTDIPSSYKTTVEGLALIKNGQIVNFDGDKDISLPSYDELKGNFNFDEGNFNNIIDEANRFQAEVVSPSQFYGADVNVNDLTVVVEYTNTSLTAITLTYKVDYALVKTVYLFEN